MFCIEENSLSTLLLNSYRILWRDGFCAIFVVVQKYLNQHMDWACLVDQCLIYVMILKLLDMMLMIEYLNMQNQIC